jgi:hypothetical protein
MKQVKTSYLAGQALDRQIERLVDGELPELERGDLLRRLGTEPDGWRRCALAFLEAQCWREVFQPLAAGEVRLACSEKTSSWRQRRPAALGFLGMAAALVLVFGLGWAARGNSGASPGAVLTARADRASRQGGPEGMPDSTNQARSEPVASASLNPKSALAAAASLPRKHAYQAETQTRLASVVLKDGRKVQVPVQEVRLRYVGNRTY